MARNRSNDCPDEEEADAPRANRHSVFSGRMWSRSVRAAIGKRLALGLMMALFAIVAGWVLVPPEASTDQATIDWYSR